MTHKVYITKAGKFLPNQGIENDEMEEYLGFINHLPSKSKQIVLRNNGIKQRFYALDKKGNPTHSNSQIVALAIRNMFDNNIDEIKKIDLLSCGTSTPDQMIPSHGLMVHGWLPEANGIEVVSLSGVCCSGMHALKYAYMSIKCGEVANAVSTGSERVSPLLKSSCFENEVTNLSLLEENPYLSFEKDFLRWMLSDGAAAFLLQNKPNENSISLRIDWIEGVSYANETETCMYMACEKVEDGVLKSYMDYSSSEIIEHSIMSIKQDIKLLSKHVVSFAVSGVKSALRKNKISVDEIDYFLPHISSEFFRSKLSEKLDAEGMGIPQEKWFTNLTTVGNVGAGSIYLMLEELFHSNTLKKGQKILMFVPESARFSYMYGLLTVC